MKDFVVIAPRARYVALQESTGELIMISTRRRLRERSEWSRRTLMLCGPRVPLFFGRVMS